MQKQQVQYLVTKYVEGQSTPAEEKLLLASLEDDATREDARLIMEELMAAEPESTGYNPDAWNPVIQQILNHKPQRARILRSTWLKIAATVIISIGIGTIYLAKYQGNKTGKGDETKVLAQKDVAAPMNSKARITLGNGQTISLDSLQAGAQVAQGNVTIVKLANGQISYRLAEGALAGDVMAGRQHELNTLTNPRGSQVIDITLNDGSRVWLNAGSSITYPVAFTGNERKVEMTGEAYFEITHDAAKPFYVSKADMIVQVLGTHFNVNAYDDEGSIRVTLLEGSVRVANPLQEVKIRPGEQARIGKDISVVAGVETDEVMAWKNGMFLLDNTDLPTIMRQISRWYDVQVVYEGKIPARQFGGGVSKELPLSKIIGLLKANGIDAELNGKILTIK